MKIYYHEDFLALPEGVLFCKGIAWSFGEIQVKGETVGSGSYWSRYLNGIDFHDSGQMVDRFEEMKGQGASYPLDTAYSRCGPCADDDLFLVFEADDLVALRQILEAAPQIS